MAGPHSGPYKMTSIPSNLARLPNMLSQQIVLAAKIAYEEVTNLQEAFDNVDANEALIDDLVYKPTGVRLRMVEVGAGDNSFGLIFFDGTTDVAAVIQDGDLYDCAVFTQ